MRRFARHVVNSFLRPFNVEVRRLTPLHLSQPFFVQSLLVKKDSPTVFDVGAHVGDVSESYRTLFPTSTVHAFEPFPESFRSLRERFAQDPAVRLNEIAVSDAEGSTAFHANRSCVTNSIMKTDPRGAQFWGTGLLDTDAVIEVPTTTLDAYCEKNQIDSIDILKLDIQGAELQALRGAKALLGNSKIALIYMELLLAPTYVGQALVEDYLRFLRALGYNLLDIYNLARQGPRLIQVDAIFLPKA